MRPLAEFPLAERRSIDWLLTDIDDTMTQDGRLPSTSLLALERLQAAGLRVIPVTGRPAGWCDHIARMWPVDAVVGENGALWFAYDRESRKMSSGFAKSPAEQAEDRKKLDILRDEILAKVPGSAIASDQSYRLADLAIDFCEDVDPLPKSEIDHIVRLFEQAGATAKVSSIHVNGWFGQYDKLTMTKRCVTALTGLELAAINDQCVYAGDSPNDQPMFEFFNQSVGVANVRDFELETPPTWVTPGHGATGFAELAEALLAAK